MLTVWALPGAYGAVAAARDGNESKVEVLLEQVRALVPLKTAELARAHGLSSFCVGRSLMTVLTSKRWSLLQ